MGAASSPYAADLTIAPVAAPVIYEASGFDWSGFYAGLVGGYSWGTVETTEVPPPNPTWKVNPNGAMLGVTAGVNAQFDQFVLGAEGEIMWAGITDTRPDPRVPLNSTISTKSDWQGALKLRAGVAIDRILVYAHGGLAFADLKSTVSPDYSYNTVRTGFTIGAGVETAVTDQISVKAEYAYTDFGTWNGTYTGTPGTFDVEQKYAAHSIKAGINFHF